MPFLFLPVIGSSFIRHPHRCQHCGSEVDELATNSLSCCWSEGRIPQHMAVNDIICRFLVSAGVRSHLEPGGLCRSDGKRPDGVSIIPWKDGKPIIWDATCPDTYAPSHQDVSATGAGKVAEQAEQVKCSKYALLQKKYTFVPVGIETSGAFGPSALSFTKDLGRQLKLHTFESNSCQYF